MTPKSESIQIQLTHEQTQALNHLAREQGKTIIELVEEMLQDTIRQRQQAGHRKLAQQLEALERIKRHKAEILASRKGEPLNINLVTMLQEIREERD
ncbi:MAG: hypothetical protein MN733_13175, partial [Nitrososphaera sp.]|nr:hypothetical protein [Nitrososphaera sp.]